jgi:hypothetical protein
MDLRVERDPPDLRALARSSLPIRALMSVTRSSAAWCASSAVAASDCAFFAETSRFAVRGVAGSGSPL